MGRCNSLKRKRTEHSRTLKTSLAQQLRESRTPFWEISHWRRESNASFCEKSVAFVVSWVMISVITKRTVQNHCSNAFLQELWVMNSTRMPSFIEMVHSAKKFYIFSEVMGIFLGVHWSRGSLSLKCQTQTWAIFNAIQTHTQGSLLESL